jgi:hypothetical protein
LGGSPPDPLWLASFGPLYVSVTDTAREATGKQRGTFLARLASLALSITEAYEGPSEASQGGREAQPVTARRAKRENGGLGKDPPGRSMTGFLREEFPQIVCSTPSNPPPWLAPLCALRSHRMLETGVADQGINAPKHNLPRPKRARWGPVDRFLIWQEKIVNGLPEQSQEPPCVTQPPLPRGVLMHILRRYSYF